MRKTVLPVLFILFLSGCADIFSPGGPIKLDPEIPLIRPGPHMQFCADPTNEKGITEIQSCDFQQLHGFYPSFGIRDSAVWVRFQIEPAAVPSDWFFEVANTFPREISFFRLRPDGTLIDRIDYNGTPARLRRVPHRYFVLPLTQITQPETIYIRARSSGGLNLPVFLWNARDYTTRDMLRTSLFSMFFGVLIAMSLYNFFLYVSTRDRAYLYYVLYVIVVLEYFSLVSGYAVHFVPDSLVGDLPAIGPITALASTFFALLFSRRFLLLTETRPGLAKAANIVIVIHMASLAAYPLLPILMRAALGNLLPGIGIVVIFVSSIVRIRDGFRPARYFLIAWAALMLGVTLFILQNLNLIPGGFTTHYSQFFGAALEAILLSLALGYRITSLSAAEQEARRVLVQEQARALAEQKAMSESFSRFVPAEFLEYLGKTSVMNIAQGDATRKEMAVLFLDIRSFTQMSEGLGSEGTFSFLNEFHGGMEPIIQKHGGFIDKFIGDAIMALFPLPSASVQAAVEMRGWARAQGRVKIGIGIHFGELMLGTVGSPRRLETTVIGDTVNLASRIESINKMYGTELVISDAVYKHLQDDGGISARELDAIRVRGKKQPIVLYEVLSGLSPNDLERRLENMSTYMTGLLSFRTGDFAASRTSFEDYLNRCGEDSVVRMYLKRLDGVKQSASWDGIWEAEV